MDPERSKEQYRECMHNHAATLGTYAIDGCGEYMPDSSTLGGLNCAACGCHRNFHRKFVAVEAAAGGGSTAVVAFSSPATSMEEGAAEGKRRTRTKFSVEQKEQMQLFAERIGWRVQRRDGGGSGEDEITRFCREIGVTRQIFKVWMHNHKNSTASSSTTTNNDSNNVGNASSLSH
uniref:ZF-HD homeobox protein At5g65410 n=1 Tax=Anthurium amnicola TaxID=1678845 RepID=A0A1D1YZ50_9ARAE